MENYFQMNFDTNRLQAVSTLGLAHIGDGVYELLCRAYLCEKGDQTVLKLHKDTVNMVKAPAQAKYMDKLLPHLTEEELAFYEEKLGLAKKFADAQGHAKRALELCEETAVSDEVKAEIRLLLDSVG